MTDIESSLLWFSREIAKEHKVILSGECADEFFGGYPWFYRKELNDRELFPWINNLEYRQNLLNENLQKDINLKEIVEKEYENWKQMNTKRIYINKAEKQEAELELAEMKRKVIPIQKGEEKEISIEINAIYQYEAPVIEGTKIGNIIVKRKEEIVETIDITLAKTIEKKSSLNYLIQLITTLPNYQLIK